MLEISFFFSSNDKSLPLEVVNRGYCLVVNKDYGVDEGLLLYSLDSNAGIDLCQRFYVLPSASFVADITMGYGQKNSGKKFQYIMDRVGAAAIDLTLHKFPSEGEVCVGSLAFQTRTYRAEDKPLSSLPSSYADAFKDLLSYIKSSAVSMPNAGTPKNVYVFPEAMALLRQDFSFSPWSSLEITD